MKGGKGRPRTHQTRAGRTVKPMRGLKQVELACNRYLSERGLLHGFNGNDFFFGEPQKRQAALRQRMRKEERLEKIAQDMGQEEMQ